MKKIQNTQSPLHNKPIRSPGQSLNEQIEELMYDKFLTPLMVVIFILAMAIQEWVAVVMHTPRSPFLYLCFAFGAIVYFLYQVRRYWPILNKLKRGRDGEKVVGQRLEELRKMDYKIFHDLVDPKIGFNIDHIIVGPAGVFTIETKTISKSKGKSNHVKRYKDTLKVGGFIPTKNPLEQAKAQASWVKNFLYEFLGEYIPVRSVVVYPGWFVESGSRDDVWVLNDKALPSFLKNEPVVLDSMMVSSVSYALKRYYYSVK